MTATLTLSAGRPNFDWENVLKDVLTDGTLSGAGAQLVLDNGDGITLTINGSGLASDNNRTITAGAIGELILTSPDGALTLTFSSALLSFVDLQGMIDGAGAIGDAYSFAFKTLLAPLGTLESVDATGSDDDDSIFGTVLGGDNIETGNGNDFILINTNAETGAVSNIDGGDGFDFLGLNYAHGVRMDYGSGELRDNDDDHLIATFSNLEGFGGTQFDDRVLSADDNEGDYFWAASLGNDQYEGFGEGYTRLSYVHLANDSGGVANGRIEVDYQTETIIKYNDLDEVVGTDRFWGINTVQGTAFADSFVGDVWGNEFQGMAGNDTFVGGGGRDVVNYEDDDQFGGSSGVIVNLSATEIIADIGSGNTTVAAGSGRDGFGNTDTYTDISGVRGTKYDDYIAGTNGRDELRGGAGNDTIIGGGGDDELEGGNGDDSIDAGDGHDFIQGGVGNDTVNGGAGNDRLGFYNDRDSHAGDAIQVTLSGAGGTVTGDYWDDDSDAAGTVNTSFTGIDTFEGTSGDDTFEVLADFQDIPDGRDWRTFEDFRDPEGTVLFIGGRGADTFTDSGTTLHPYGVAVVGYADEFWMDAEGNDDENDNGRNFGVFVNLSNATVTISDFDNGEILGANTIGSGFARDTFGDTDQIVGATLFDLTHRDDYFFGRNAGGDQGVYVQGNDGDDYLVGGSGADVLSGDRDNDTLMGLGGADRLDGGDGDDSVDGGDGSDRLGGGQGNDTLLGGAGRDNINGDDGNDSLEGGSGMDRLWGGQGDDTLKGGADNDQLEGDDGNDLEYGEGGDDSVNGGQGNDTLLGGEGNDRLRGDDGNDILSGDDDNFSNGNVAALQAGATGSGDDELRGGQGNDTLYGGGGSDRLDGDEGNDQLWGGEGNDELHSGQGNDTLNGGSGHDKLWGDDNNDVLNGDDGNDYLDGGSGNDTLDGGAGRDNLDGGDNNDRLFGGTGSDKDRLNGGSGNDTLVAGSGNDRLYGDNGDDTYELAGFSVGDIWDSSGSDTITTTVSRDLGDFGNIENAIVLGSSSGRNLTGNSLDNELTGNSKTNILSGEGGKDTLDGAGGSDTLIGGSGKDLLIGGSSADTFVFNSTGDSGSSSSSRDVIFDFAHGTDKIDVSAIDANTTKGGNQAFVLDSKGSSGTSVAKGHIGWYQENKSGTANDKTILKFNVDNDSTIEMTIELKGLISLTSSDFIL